MPNLQDQKTITIEIDEQKIITQDKTKFLQTTFKAPPAVTQLVTKEWLEKDNERIDAQIADSNKKVKEYVDKLLAQKERNLLLIKEF